VQSGEFGEGRDPAGCGFAPVFGGFVGVHPSADRGPRRGFGLLGWGRQGRGWGWGELPASPGRSPQQVPRSPRHSPCHCRGSGTYWQRSSARTSAVHRIPTRRRANHGQSTDDSPRCLPPAPGKAGIGAVGGMSRCGALGLRGSGGRDADGVYPRYRAGQGPLPVGSTQVETPRYPASDPAVSTAGALDHPTSDTNHSTGCK
jgi:hypothetical protein